MLSPVWRVQLCSSQVFSNGVSGRLELEDGEAEAVATLIELGCGARVSVQGGLGGLLEIGRVADKYGMEEACAAVEDEALQRLTLDTCAQLLMGSGCGGMGRVERASRALALERFEAFAATEGFLWLDEDTLQSLLEDSALRADREEPVFEAVARWIRTHAAISSDGGGIEEGHTLPAEKLLRAIRFSLMDGEYLAGRARQAVPGSGVLGSLVEAALEAQAGRREGNLVEHSDARRGLRVPWAIHMRGGGGREAETEDQVFCGAVVGDRLCCGGWNGVIKVLHRATLSEERQLCGHTRVVCALVAWERWLVSGSSDKQVRAWDPCTGQCEAILRGHTGGVSSLALCGARLLSGSDDGTVRVWGLRGPPAEWRLERLLSGGRRGVRCVGSSGQMVLGGCSDGTVWMWDIGSGVLVRTLSGHVGAVLALLVDGSWMATASKDQTVRVWSVESGTCLQTMAVPGGPGNAKENTVGCLALVGSEMVGGTTYGRVWVWDRLSLELAHSLELDGRPAVRGLVVDGAAVIGLVGTRVLLWSGEA